MTQVFIASNLPTGYPFKLQKPATLTESVRETAESFILDSGIGNDDMTNADVLDLAHEYDADYVIGKDYLWDQERTTESIVHEFHPQYQAHPCDATPMIPLQPDHARHFDDLCRAFRETYAEELPYDHFVLGGMSDRDVSDDDVVEYIRRFREIAPDAYVHALGIGGGRSVALPVARDGPTRLAGLRDARTRGVERECDRSGTVPIYGSDHERRGGAEAQHPARGVQQLAAPRRMEWRIRRTRVCRR